MLCTFCERSDSGVPRPSLLRFHRRAEGELLDMFMARKFLHLLSILLYCILCDLSQVNASVCLLFSSKTN